MKPMNDYTKGILTGASLILCFFMFVSAKSQSKNLGDITVNSIKVVDDDGDMVGELGSIKKAGFLTIWNESGLKAVLGTEGGSGYLGTYNPDGKQSVSIGTSETGSGLLEVYSSDAIRLVSIGEMHGDGKISIFHANGNATVVFGTLDGQGSLLLASPDGKATTYLGDGMLRTFNQNELMTGYFGTSKDNDGMAVLSDSYGDIGWSASGKK